MNFIIADVLNAIEKEPPSIASWAKDKRHTLSNRLLCYLTETFTQ